MRRKKRDRWSLAVCLSFLFAAHSVAATNQVDCTFGSPRAEFLQRYGAAQLASDDGADMFWTNGIAIMVWFAEGKAARIGYRKLSKDNPLTPVDFTEEEIKTLLKKHAGGEKWTLADAAKPAERETVQESLSRMNARFWSRPGVRYVAAHFGFEKILTFTDRVKEPAIVKTPSPVEGL